MWISHSHSSVGCRLILFGLEYSVWVNIKHFSLTLLKLNVRAYVRTEYEKLCLTSKLLWKGLTHKESDYIERHYI